MSGGYAVNGSDAKISGSARIKVKRVPLLHRFARWILSESPEQNTINPYVINETRIPSNDMSSDRFRINVFFGEGGIAVEVHSDSGNVKLGPSTQIRLHIIPEGKDLGEALAHILTLENIRR